MASVKTKGRLGSAPDKPSQAYRLWIGLTFVIGLGAFFAWKYPIQQEETATPSVSVVKKAEAPQLDPVDKEPVLAVPSEPIHDQKSDPNNPYQVIFAQHPELKESEYLYSVVLETPEVNERRYKVFTQFEGVRKAFDALTDARSETFGNWTPLERVFWVNWIKQAAQMEDNPQRGYIKDRLFQGILSFPENYKSLSPENRKSMMADKIELYLIALRYFSGNIEQLNAEIKDERLRKMVSYARKHIEYLSQMDMSH